jgi:hypothetical protein
MTATGRPALRVALLGVGAAVVAAAVIWVYLGAKVADYQAAFDRATAVAEGVVVEDSIGDEGDVRVRWADDAGTSRTTRFGIYDYDRYVEGAAFGVRYDPRDPAGRAFPADPEETSGLDDLQVPQLFGVVGAVLVGGFWGYRGWRFRLTSRRSGVPVRARVLTGESEQTSAISLGLSCWLELRPDDGEPRWQRVMWHTALDAVPDELDVVVHGSLTGRRRVVPELPDGTLLVPVGRLRSQLPRTIELSPRESSRAEADDLWLFPPGAPVPPQTAWWRRPVQFAAVGAVVGTGMALVFGGGAAIVPMAAGVAALTTNGWAFMGAEP